MKTFSTSSCLYRQQRANEEPNWTTNERYFLWRLRIGVKVTSRPFEFVSIINFTFNAMSQTICDVSVASKRMAFQASHVACPNQLLYMCESIERNSDDTMIIGHISCDRQRDCHEEQQQKWQNNNLSLASRFLLSRFVRTKIDRVRAYASYCRLVCARETSEKQSKNSMSLTNAQLHNMTSGQWVVVETDIYAQVGATATAIFASLSSWSHLRLFQCKRCAIL